MRLKVEDKLDRIWKAVDVKMFKLKLPVRTDRTV